MGVSRAMTRPYEQMGNYRARNKWCLLTVDSRWWALSASTLLQGVCWEVLVYEGFAGRRTRAGVVERWEFDRDLVQAVLDALEHYQASGDQEQVEAFARLYRRLKGA